MIDVLSGCTETFPCKWEIKNVNMTLLIFWWITTIPQENPSGTSCHVYKIKSSTSVTDLLGIQNKTFC